MGAWSIVVLEGWFEIFWGREHRFVGGMDRNHLGMIKLTFYAIYIMDFGHRITCNI